MERALSALAIGIGIGRVGKGAKGGKGFGGGKGAALVRVGKGAAR